MSIRPLHIIFDARLLAAIFLCLFTVSSRICLDWMCSKESVEIVDSNEGEQDSEKDKDKEESKDKLEGQHPTIYKQPFAEYAATYLCRCSLRYLPMLHSDVLTPPPEHWRLYQS